MDRRHAKKHSTRHNYSLVCAPVLPPTAVRYDTDTLHERRVLGYKFNTPKPPNNETYNLVYLPYYLSSLPLSWHLKSEETLSVTLEEEKHEIGLNSYVLKDISFYLKSFKCNVFLL